MLLMRKNTIVADVELKLGNIWKINQIYNKEALPVGVFEDSYQFGENDGRDISLLNQWWKNNSIPTERDSIRIGLNCLGIEDLAELKVLSRGLSLLNHYWLKENDEKITWEDVNYWDNTFSKKIGEALFNHKPVHDINSQTSPDTGLNGVLKKKWIIKDNDYYIVKDGSGLFKQEVFNEVFASKICNIANIKNANYEFYYEEDSKLPYCMSKCFTSKDEEFVSMLQVWDNSRKERISDYEKAINILNKYKIDNPEQKINDILVLDYILAGSDRHLNNFGLLHNIETDTFSFAPVFDSGTCLWCNKVFAEDIDIEDKNLVARPFGGQLSLGYWDKQKELIFDYINLPKEDLFNALKEYYDDLVQIAKMPESRAEAISIGCIKRTYNLQKYLISKGCKIEDNMLITDKNLEKIKDFLTEDFNKEQDNYPLPGE